MTPTLLISEEFQAPQGEGPNMGRPMYWVRLGGCNQACSWCDAAYACFYDERHASQHESGVRYDPKTELTRSSVEALATRIAVTNYTTVSLTGGEPLLQQEALGGLLDHPLMQRQGQEWHFETAGTVVPWRFTSYGNVFFNVSPKLASSGNPLEVRRVPKALQALAALPSVFKFVLDTRSERYLADLTEVEYLVREHAIPPHRVWLMPCGTTSQEVAQGMAILEPLALARQWNLSGRLQVFMHGDQRGW
jgi:7-carboxy-7-deazaguanine synthase